MRVGAALLTLCLATAGEGAPARPRGPLGSPESETVGTGDAAQAAALAPDFELTDTYGQAVRLSELRHRVVVLQFWARWCSSCEADLEAFQTLFEESSDRGLLVLGLGHASGSRREIAGFADSLGITFPMLLCTEEVRSLYEVAVFPTTLLVDGQGRVRLRRTGALTPEYWRRVIAELLDEEAAASP